MKKIRKCILSILLTASIMVSQVPITVTAASEDGICDHHAVHTTECGYKEAVFGQDCNHNHNDDCGYKEPTEEIVCSCGETDEGGTLIHNENCNYVPADEGEECNHHHDENCSYLAPVDGQSCQYECAECVQPEEENYRSNCICESKCAEDLIYIECSVCSKEGADMTECRGVVEVSWEDTPSEQTVEGTQVQENLTEITDVYVTIELPVLWSKNTELKISVEEYQPYVVSLDAYGTHWRDGGGGEIDSFNNAIFIAGFRIFPKDGYQLTSQTKLWINGSQTSIIFSEEEPILVGDVTYASFPIIKETIREVSLEIAEPQKDTLVEDYSYVDPVNQRFQVTGEWYRYNYTTGQYEAMSPGTDRFKAGEIYELQLSLNLAEGYEIAYNSPIIINEEINTYWENNLQQMNMTYFVSLDIEKQNMVHLPADAIPVARVGESFTAESRTISTEETGIAVSGYWIEDGKEKADGVFKEGKVYYYVLNITPKAGYVLADDLMLFIGGEYIAIFPSSNISSAQYRYRVSFLPTIENIEIRNLPQANLGDTLQWGWFDVEVPEDALYEAKGIWMYQVGEYNFESIREDDGSNIVKLGNKYVLEVYITPIAGYDIADNVQVKVDGVIHTLDSNDVWYDFVRFSQSFDFTETNSQEDTTVEKPDNTNPSQEIPTLEEFEEISSEGVVSKNEEENMSVTSFVNATAVKAIPVEVKDATSKTIYNISKIATTRGFVAAVDKIVKANIKEKTVVLYSDKPFTFNAISLAALTNAKKEFVYMFKHNGHIYKVTIPVGAKVDLEGQRFAGPLYIGAKLGTTVVIK